MTSIAFAFVVFGLFLIAWAIVNPGNATPARRTVGASVGLVGLLLGLLTGMASGHDDDRRHRDY
jgi:hypothetical protein